MQSGFLNYIEPGDVVCGDRGFTIDNLLVKKGADLAIPPFLKGRDKLSLEEEEQCRLIAKARIHIERWNERMKIFQFVKGPVKQQKVCLLSQAVYVCGCLANFSRELAV